MEGFTDDHVAAFRRCGVQRVLIAYDRDDAGDCAAVKLAERLMTEGLACYRVQFPHLAALDVHRAKVFGRCEAITGIAPFARLVDQVMSQPPYNTAHRVFWVMDNGSSHRGQASVQRLTKAYPRLVPIHTPVHASWLNQIEIYFSIVQRKALTPNDFACLQAVADRLAEFERYFESIARPFEWKFTRTELNALIARMRDRWARSQPLKLAA